MPSHFFDLPRELRDMVYNYTWLAIPMVGISRANSCSTLSAEYTFDPPDNLDLWCGPATSRYQFRCTKGLPRWLLTSKEVLDEGIETFKRSGRMSIIVNHSYFEHDYAKDANRMSECSRDRLPTLLPLDRSRHLFLQFLNAMATPTGIVHEPNTLLYWDLRDAAYCRDLFADIRKAGKLKHLDLRLDASVHPDATTYQADLEPIADLVSSVGYLIDYLDIYIRTEEDNEMNLQVRSSVEKALWGEVQKLNNGVLKDMESNVQQDRIGGTRVYTGKVCRGWRLLWIRK